MANGKNGKSGKNGKNGSQAERPGSVEFNTKIGNDGRKYIFLKMNGNLEAFVQTDTTAAISDCMKSDVVDSATLSKKENGNGKSKPLPASELRKFRCLAMKEGKRYGGTFAAEDEEVARSKLIKQGFEIVSITEVGPNEKALKTVTKALKPKEKAGLDKKDAVPEDEEERKRLGPKIETDEGKSEEEIIIKNAWEKSGHMCQCKNTEHRHMGQCRDILNWALRGKEEEKGAWEVYKPERGKPISEENCKIVCMYCYQEMSDL